MSFKILITAQAPDRKGVQNGFSVLSTKEWEYNDDLVDKSLDVAFSEVSFFVDNPAHQT